MKRHKAKTTELRPRIVVERQGSDILVWVENTLIRAFKARYTHGAGKPLEIANHILDAFKAVNIDARLEIDLPDPSELQTQTKDET